ncbi:hypothetical protein CLU96_2365 [Chryseobacterium sp. 52]|uniref:AVAST type 2 anti-phage system protein Avs2 n=1 Tax=Chryseobacterium sp. 52 TaxID=2035213 RepID=UPI000C198EF3|nr:AVAST type 2 anti-phage system protein Avs2 [Chryseobacterium sp. 52]PIF45363.1 hypothetical protein CLU96_2365 [Chryseobacterium sp. 52]
MDQENDQLLTLLSVRLVNIQTAQTAGSGIIYSHPTLQQQVYILTAAHCLFEDQDNFEIPMEAIELYFFNAEKQIYETLVHKINYNLVSADIDHDVAVLVLNLTEVESITGKLPTVNMILNRNAHTQFVAKGFPSATRGKEIVFISPSWVQQLPGKEQFQLHINQDFSDAYNSIYRIDGFSGAGIFLYDHQQVYLYGIFTRFLDAGKMVYCQPLTQFESIINANYLPPFSYTFFGAYGVSSEFFLANAKKSIKGLGPRFNAELNFQLPISFYFNAIAKDSSFKQMLTKIVNNQLTASLYGAGGADMEGIEARYNELNDRIRGWYDSITWRTDEQIVIKDIIEKINHFETDAQNKRTEFYQKRQEKIQEQGTNRKQSYYPEPYASEISHLGQMLNSLSTFTEACDQCHIALSNYPVLLIKGGAGAGKSHLLGDILQKRNAEGFPSVLLLGQLFTPGQSVWDNVLNQLGLSCTRQEFLSTLNSIGEQIGTRVLIMVDAINEGAGKKLWHDAIEGFIHDCLEYPSIGLVISIRTTYWKSIIPETLNMENLITQTEHHGFKGNEYEAVKLFCEFYGIQQPNFPLLNPEYSNPLFLHLICKGIQGSTPKIFPQGFQGITKVFGYYLKAVKNKLIQKRDIYEYAPKLLINALNSFAKHCFEKDRRSMSLSEAIKLFDEQYSGFPHLIGDLIEESVLIRSLSREYDFEGKAYEEEQVYFAYERFGDFYIAGELIKDIKTKEEALKKFEKDEPLGKLIEDGGWYNSGTLEALAVLLPEKFDIEIFEVYNWVFKEEKKNHLYNDHSIPHWYLNSLRWRTLESIDNKKFIKWVKTTKQFRISNEEYFNFLYEMSAIEGHPFNSDRMTDMFLRFPMPERDGFIQQYFLYYSGKDDSGTAMPINRLIDWAWRPDISKQTSKETARLVAQALCWILGSTHTALRDQATKAMVNLLQDQIPALIEVFIKLVKIDDIYITERLCAVAYGCALRAKNTVDLHHLAQIVYDNIFRDENPPTHILIRDYCRHIIELAIYKGISLDMPVQNFRPPYNAKLPERYPTEEELEVFKIGKDEKGEVGNIAQANSKAIFSILGWDFGRYTIDSAVRNFESVQFSFENDIEDFRRGLRRGGKGAFKNVKACYPMYAKPRRKLSEYSFENKEIIQKYWNGVDELWEIFEQRFIKLLSDEQKSFYQEKLLPYWDLQIKNQKDRDLELKSKPIKIWIAKRVFELGYDGKVHGSFDGNRDSYERNETAKIERIGKKYQWIAFYQILGVLADNYKVRDLYGSDTKSRFYNGPWDVTYRDIDPSFTSRIDRNKYPEDDFGIVEDNPEWYLPPRYMHWNKLHADWADTTADLPNYAECIQRTDQKGEEWVYLYSSHTWKAPKAVGESRSHFDRKEIWFMFQSFLVPKDKYQRTVKWLQNQEFHGRWLPEAYEVSNLVAREAYWSPLSKQYGKEHGTWRTLEDSNLKVMLTSLEAIGSLEGDDSGAHFHYKIPNKKMFDKLEFRYADHDGELLGPTGEVLFSNISPLGPMIRKDTLEKFLSENNLEIIWTLLGEKNAFYNRELGQDIRKSLSGVFGMEDRELKGTIKITDW